MVLGSASEVRAQCSHACDLSQRDPRTGCCPAVHPAGGEIRRPAVQCASGQHMSAGHCCGMGEEFVAARNMCLCVDPSTCGQQPSRAASPATPRSCSEMHARSPSLPSGAYTIDPDGPGASPAFAVWCDMTDHGGGWILIARLGGSVDASTLGVFNSDLGVEHLVTGAAPGASEFSHWNVTRFDAYGSSWTIRISVDSANDGSHYQYTFYRPRSSATISPSEACSNWRANTAFTRLSYLVASSTSGRSNTTWLDVPGFDTFGETGYFLGSRQVSIAAGRDCMSTSGQTQFCQAQAGWVAIYSGETGTISGWYGHGDGVAPGWRRRALYWLRDTVITGTP